jgi:hypothetical protein
MRSFPTYTEGKKAAFLTAVGPAKPREERGLEPSRRGAMGLRYLWLPPNSNRRRSPYSRSGAFAPACRSHGLRAYGEVQFALFEEIRAP